MEHSATAMSTALSATHFYGGSGAVQHTATTVSTARPVLVGVSQDKSLLVTADVF